MNVRGVRLLVCGRHCLVQVYTSPAAQPGWQLASSSHAGAVQPQKQPVSPGMAAQQLLHRGNLTTVLHQRHRGASLRPDAFRHGGQCCLAPCCWIRPLCTSSTPGAASLCLLPCFTTRCLQSHCQASTTPSLTYDAAKTCLCLHILLHLLIVLARDPHVIVRRQHGILDIEGVIGKACAGERGLQGQGHTG